jgi:hypothetical protein
VKQYESLDLVESLLQLTMMSRISDEVTRLDPRPSRSPVTHSAMTLLDLSASLWRRPGCHADARSLGGDLP